MRSWRDFTEMPNLKSSIPDLPEAGSQTANVQRRLDTPRSENNESLPNLAVEQGPKWGWKFATLSFPNAGIRHLLGLPPGVPPGSERIFTYVFQDPVLQ